MNEDHRSVTDRIAREAARLVETGRISTVHEAIRVASEHLGDGYAPLPSVHRVRQHARAMSMQALGDAGYTGSVREMWVAAEQIMATLELLIGQCTCMLMGRAAEGLIDAGLIVHVRLYTDAKVSEIVAVLDEMEIDSPAVTTADTKVGRLNQIGFTDQGRQFILTRIPKSIGCATDRDLFSGQRVAAIDLTALRDRLATSGSGGS